MKTILVTGGAGYLGAVLVPKLLEHGFHVRVLDLFLFGREGVAPLPPQEDGRLTLIEGDLRDDGLVAAALRGVDAVIHLAGISNDPSSDLDPKLTLAINVDASQRLIDQARRAGVERFINASSSSVYGIKNDPEVTEDLPLEPLTVYSKSKVLIEQYLSAYPGEMVTCSVRSATLCGVSPRMRLDLTMNILTHHALTRGRITVFGGTQKRPNIHIEDVAEFYIDLLFQPAELIHGEAFNVCTENHTVRALADLVRFSVAPEAKVEVVPTDDLRSYHVSARKAEQVLGYRPRRTLGQAVRELAAALEDGRLPRVPEERHINLQVVKRALAENRLSV